MRLIKTLLLTVLVSGAVIAEPAKAQMSEFPRENAALINATVEFFESAEASAVPQKRERSIIGIPLQATKSRAPVNDTEVLTRMGPVQNLTGYRISWYPVDRLLGTVDFMGTWDGNRNLVCGYLTWDLTNPDDPVLESISANFVSLDEIKKASAVQVHRSLLKANCAYGDIDSNYGFFDVTG